jgi:hypothetical protein
VLERCVCLAINGAMPDDLTTGATKLVKVIIQHENKFKALFLTVYSDRLGAYFSHYIGKIETNDSARGNRNAEQSSGGHYG